MSVVKIDSNASSLYLAEETSFNTLASTPTWRELEPNSYGDLGGSISTIARNPIKVARQVSKGATTDLEASANFNMDITQNNIIRLMQGYLLADAVEKADTSALNPPSTNAPTLASVTTTTFVGTNLGDFLAGHIVEGSGFASTGNNARHVLSAANATTLTTTGLTAESSAPAGSRVRAVGYQFAADATNGLNLTLTGNLFSLTNTTAGVNLTTLGLTVGEWIFVGGDTTNSSFGTTGTGYARISSIAANAIGLDDVTFTATATIAATGTRTPQIYFGTIIYNRNTSANITRRTYNLERQLGSDSTTDTTSIQSEYITGAMPSELSINIPAQDKMNADFTFLGADHETRTGSTGIKTGTRVSALNEEAINTSSDMFRGKMYVVSSTDSTPDDLFTYMTEATITLNNNVTYNKAIGTLGAFDLSYGNIEIGGSITAYFSTVDSIQTIRDNDDVAFNTIFARDNEGMVFDIPLLSVSGGIVGVTLNEAMTIPLEITGAENSNNYTIMTVFFPYLPNAAMPT